PAAVLGRRRARGQHGPIARTAPTRARAPVVSDNGRRSAEAPAGSGVRGPGERRRLQPRLPGPAARLGAARYPDLRRRVWVLGGGAPARAAGLGGAARRAGLRDAPGLVAGPGGRRRGAAR